VARLEGLIKKEKSSRREGGERRRFAAGFRGRGVAEVASGTEIVLVHDAVRPFVTPEQVARVIEEARRCGRQFWIRRSDTVKE